MGQLRESGYAVRILARSPDSKWVRELVSNLGVEVQQGNVLEPGSLPGALADVEALIHLVGIISEVGQNTFLNVHLKGTQNVVAAAQQAGLRRFLHMSALGTRPNAVSCYHRTKWEAEQAVRQSGMAFTIFRPSLIYGPDDQFINLFARIIRYSPVVPLLGSPHAKFQPVSVAAVATAFARSIGMAQTAGQTYDLCGRDLLTLEEIIDEILLVMGRRRLKLRVPSVLAETQAAFLEYVYPRLFGKAPPLNRDQLIMLHENNIGDGTPAKEQFGLNPEPFREGIARYLQRDA